MGKYFSAFKSAYFLLISQEYAFRLYIFSYQWTVQHALGDCSEHLIKRKINQVICPNQVLSWTHCHPKSLSEKNIFPITLHFLSLENITLNVVACVKSSPSSKSFASDMLQQWVPLGVSTSSFVLLLKIPSFLQKKKKKSICVCVYIHIYRFKRVFNLRLWFKEK